MEYILAGIWKGQMSNNRMLKSVPGKLHVISVSETCLKQLHLLQYEYIHHIVDFIVTPDTAV